MKEEHQTDQFNEHLLNSSFQTEKNIRVLKSNETFGIFDRYGDVRANKVCIMREQGSCLNVSF